jgi:UDP-glucuronate 4-epimerase
MKNIFITGIAGFIGFHLAQFLKKRGDYVIGCDNFAPNYDPELKKARSQLLKDAGISVFEADICHPALIQKCVIDHEISHFVHLAALAGVRSSFKYPEGYVQANISGFVQMMEICKQYPAMKFIFASSSSVYGLNEKVPSSESDATEKPASLYGATKKSDELIAHAYHHFYGIPVTGLRFFTAYGPWGRPDMAYYSFTKAILTGEPIVVYHEGKMQRDFTYIDDIVQGTAAAIDFGADYEIFNLGNHHPIEVNKLIALIEEKTGKKAIKQFLPLQKGESLITYADISKSRAKLGFHPTTTIERGMDHFLNWYFDYACVSSNNEKASGR